MSQGPKTQNEISSAVNKIPQIIEWIKKVEGKIPQSSDSNLSSEISKLSKEVSALGSLPAIIAKNETTISELTKKIEASNIEINNLKKMYEDANIKTSKLVAELDNKIKNLESKKPATSSTKSKPE